MIRRQTAYGRLNRPTHHVSTAVQPAAPIAGSCRRACREGAVPQRLSQGDPHPMKTHPIVQRRANGRGRLSGLLAAVLLGATMTAQAVTLAPSDRQDINL